MRMRKRHNLDTRMERCREYLVLDPETRKGNWRKPERGLQLEIGCGKGSFTCALAEEKPDVIVMGYPLLENDDEGPRAQLSKEVAKVIERETGIPVFLQDERYTTKDSEEFLIGANVSRKKRKKVIDQQAAVRILEYYLNNQRNGKRL